VLSAPDTAAAKALIGIANRLGTRARGLAGMSLNISPVRR
jgi:ATP-binding protein involved in chromosome partitioning